MDAPLIAHAKRATPGLLYSVRVPDDTAKRRLYAFALTYVATTKVVAVVVEFVRYPKNPDEIVVNIASLPFTSVFAVTVPYAVALFALVDLSTHVVIVEPATGATPVPAGSAPSSHRVQPPISVGLNGSRFCMKARDI
jgi:hypothetical protein